MKMKEVARSTRPSEQADLQPDDRMVPVNWPFRVLARTGKVLGKFDKLSDALSAYNNWAQASAVVLGSYVVIKRPKGGGA